MLGAYRPHAIYPADVARLEAWIAAPMELPGWLAGLLSRWRRPRRAAQPSRAPTVPCYACGGDKGWTDANGNWVVCHTCHGLGEASDL
jgi:hypothetical protein